MFSFDQDQVASVNDKTGRLANDKDGVFLDDGVGQKQGANAEAELNKSCWDQAAFMLFRVEPLDEEAHKEHGLAGKTDH